MSQKTWQLFNQARPVFDLLGDENRQIILKTLFDQGPQSVLDITKQLDLARPTVSHHLKLLLDAGLLVVEKRGKERIYRTDLGPAVQGLKELVQSLEEDLEGK